MLLVPLESLRREITVLNSRFIATLAPVSDTDGARAFLASIRAEFPDARHHVPAWILGGGNSTREYCSDDGEPSGTSGRPLLTVLKGSGLGNLAVVVTRYFGGTLLGTGGLVKAYTEAGQAVIRDVPRGQSLMVQDLMLELPYHLLERLRLVVKAGSGQIIQEDFAEQVTMTISLPESDCPALLKALADLGSGTLEPLILETRLATLPI